MVWVLEIILNSIFNQNREMFGVGKVARKQSLEHKQDKVQWQNTTALRNSWKSKHKIARISKSLPHLKILCTLKRGFFVVFFTFSQGKANRCLFIRSAAMNIPRRFFHTVHFALNWKMDAVQLNVRTTLDHTMNMYFIIISYTKYGKLSEHLFTFILYAKRG